MSENILRTSDNGMGVSKYIWKYLRLYENISGYLRMSENTWRAILVMRELCARM